MRGKSTITIILCMLLCSAYQLQAQSTLTAPDVALIREAFHLQAELGKTVWPGWEPAIVPLMYKTATTDVCFNHPNPPDDFSAIYDKLWGDTVYVRAIKDTNNYQAAISVNGVSTVLMSAPEPEDNPCRWILTAGHELFHIYQGTQAKNFDIIPYFGPYVGKNDLTFPFAYTNASVMSSCRVEAELLFNLTTADTVTATDVNVFPKVFRHMQTVLREVFVDSLQYKYKQRTEWNEGVARFVENKLANAARNKSYVPTKEFQAAFPAASYPQIWTEFYAKQRNPIRFVGEGVRGRTMFYYSGMAKAFVLDRIKPDWRNRYFTNTLDDIFSN